MEGDNNSKTSEKGDGDSSDSADDLLHDVVVNCKGYAADIKRDLYGKKLFDDNLNFMIPRFREALSAGLVDIATFKEAF